MVPKLGPPRDPKNQATPPVTNSWCLNWLWPRPAATAGFPVPAMPSPGSSSPYEFISSLAAQCGPRRKCYIVGLAIWTPQQSDTMHQGYRILSLGTDFRDPNLRVTGEQVSGSPGGPRKLSRIAFWGRWADLFLGTPGGLQIRNILQKARSHPHP